MYYSQAGEDKFLFDNIFCKSDLFPKTYIEMGALDGVKYSNTKFFEEQLGWHGILIEPNPVMFKKLKVNRPKNFLSNDIVSNCKETVEFAYFENENLSAVSGIKSTLTKNNKEKFFENEEAWFKTMRRKHLKTLKKTPVSLDSIIEESNIKEFGFCSLDVEGHELHVLKSFSFKKRIHFFLIEHNPNSNEIRNLLRLHNYDVFAEIAHNTIYKLVQSY